MIKIRDDFDLDKLIGFKKDAWNYIYDTEKEGVETSILISRDRTVSILNYVGCKECTPIGAVNEEIPSMLYNLFKMGIMQEVRDVKD